MPIFGLALTLRDPQDAFERVKRALRADVRVEIGERVGARLPIVLETEGARDEQPFIEALLTSGDVLHVDIAFAHFEDLNLSVDAEEARRGHEA